MPAGCIDTLRGLFLSPTAASNSTTHLNGSGSSSGTSSVSGGLPSALNPRQDRPVDAALAIVDMGSNGIRFGIISALDRHLPVLYEERAPISLFDAQFSGDTRPQSLTIAPFAIRPTSDLKRTATAGSTGAGKGSRSGAGVTPSISNSATIAVLGRSEDEEADPAEVVRQEKLEDADDGFNDEDRQAALRRTLVATDENDLTIRVSPAPNPRSERVPIPEKVIDEVVRTFVRWKTLCQQANVKEVRLIATEATRTAPNSQEFQDRIKAATGWPVEVLLKKEEAEVGALGVMASYHTVEGLFMDLGGGSVQLNYIIRGPKDGAGKSSPNARSWAYGAAALSRRLNLCGDDKVARKAIFDGMVQDFKQGLEDIEVAPVIRERQEREGGYRLYLSGGGFRALGYLLMARKIGKKNGSRYPIPIINGYVASSKELASLVQEYRDLDSADVKTSFRVSKRRAAFIPACATLMAAVMEVIPIRDVYFSEGGVRQGGCFGMLATEVQNKDPAFEAVSSFVASYGGCGQPALQPSDVDLLSSFVASAIPTDIALECRPPSAESGAGASASAGPGDDISSSGKKAHANGHAEPPKSGMSAKEAAEVQLFFNSLPRLIPLMVLVVNCFNNLPKETRSTASWQLFLPGGALSNCYGLTHTDRAILATVLAERHEGDLADPDTAELVKALIPGQKISKQACKYLGKILCFAGMISPMPQMATHILGHGVLPAGKHGGRLYFEQAPRTENEGDLTVSGHQNRRDPNRTRVGGEHSDSDSSSGSSDSDGARRGRKRRDVHGKGKQVEDGNENVSEEMVVLREAITAEGTRVHGRVLIRVEKGHPLLDSPNVQQMILDMVEAAKKAHGFHGKHDNEKDSGRKGKGKAELVGKGKAKEF
ncbi:hypothetical protein BGW38_006141 [Lunasporangiospora selenospora]|uniref:Ppx/GppA phosphatase domain-containing protein n=1 Tax=Lunasporangiospora selenospora TaxID=979761 RepID=A0A9P6FP23_9FUNG|nr:hypothetical protein BGW38_006141 [Lunasporangiospora selenospora]